MPITKRNKNKKRVMLFNPPLYFLEGEPKALDVSVPPLGLLYLASYANNYLATKVQVEVVDVAVENLSLNQIKEKIVATKPMVIGITAMTPQLQGAVELAAFLKNNFPRLKIFLGGPHISADRDFINRFSTLFDYAITGEGEKTFTSSMAKLIAGKKISKIQTGEIVKNLDLLPFPNRKLIKREKYSQYESMMFSRGCPFNCYYCSRPSISRLVRYRTVANLMEEIKNIYHYCQGKIDFQDDTFTLDEKKVVDFCEVVKRSGLKLKWRCNTRIDLVNENLLFKMKQAGCELIHFGIEAGSEEIRKGVVNKGQFTNGDIHRVIRTCHKLGIKFAGYFIIGHPGEGKKELEKTKRLILESGLDLMGHSIPTPFPGSKLYEIAKSRKIINEQILDRFARGELGLGYVGNYPLFISEKVSKEELFSLMREINRKFYVNWRTFWQRLGSDLRSPLKIKQDFEDLIALLKRGVSSRKPYVA